MHLYAAVLICASSTVAPLEDLVELQAQNYWVGLAWGKDYPESPYQGWPTDEIDALWDKYDGKDRTHTETPLPSEADSSLTYGPHT